MTMSYTFKKQPTYIVIANNLLFLSVHLREKESQNKAEFTPRQEDENKLKKAEHQ